MIDENKLKQGLIRRGVTSVMYDIVDHEISYLPKEEVIPLDRIKEAEAELDNVYEDIDWYDPNQLQTYKRRVDEVFSKLIAEVEGG